MMNLRHNANRRSGTRSSINTTNSATKFASKYAKRRRLHDDVHILSLSSARERGGYGGAPYMQFRVSRGERGGDAGAGQILKLHDSETVRPSPINMVLNE